MLDRLPPTPPHFPWLHRFALLVALMTLWLVFAGGLVTSKGAGLSVPDWPLAYGKAMPEGWFQTENIRAEHSHRIIAGTVGILTLILGIWVWRVEPRRWVRWVGFATVGAVVVQAGFGGLTVIFTRPIPVVVGHAVLGQTFFCLTVALALFTSVHWKRSPETPPVRSSRLHAASIVLTAAVFIQLVLGALMRHTESGLAIHTFPSVFGGWFPSLDEATIARINRERLYLSLSNITAAQVGFHFAHRVGAVGVCAAGAWAASASLRGPRPPAGLLVPGILILALLSAQVVLGALVVWSGKQPHITTVHVAVGAATLATSLVLTLQSFRLVPRVAESSETPSESLGSREVTT